MKPPLLSDIGIMPCVDISACRFTSDKVSGPVQWLILEAGRIYSQSGIIKMAVQMLLVKTVLFIKLRSTFKPFSINTLLMCKGALFAESG